MTWKEEIDDLTRAPTFLFLLVGSAAKGGGMFERTFLLFPIDPPSNCAGGGENVNSFLGSSSDPSNDPRVLL